MQPSVLSNKRMHPIKTTVILTLSRAALIIAFLPHGQGFRARDNGAWLDGPKGALRR